MKNKQFKRKWIVTNGMGCDRDAVYGDTMLISREIYGNVLMEKCWNISAMKILIAEILAIASLREINKDRGLDYSAQWAGPGLGSFCK